MKCPKCGNIGNRVTYQIKPRIEVCGHCGATVEEIPQQKSESNAENEE